MFTNRAKFTKANFLITRKMGVGLKYIRMAICISVNFSIIKNMAKDSSFGSIFPLKIQRPTRMSSIMKGIGGEDCQMDRAFTRKSTVYIT
jgi:hypothetical protein